MAGGGHFSGRLTAPICIAGGLCKQWLSLQGIEISARIASIAGVKDEPEFWDTMNPDFGKLCADFPVLNFEAGIKMQTAIAEAKAEGDSVGGIIECVVTGLPAGLGGPLFGGMEGKIAQAIYGIPAVKGVEFGAGFYSASLRGSENNDEYTVIGGKIRTKTNNAGGILGGITTGMPLTLKAAIKPTPSILKQQHSVSLEAMEETTLQIQGRHDPCIVPRAVPVIEAAVAIAVYDSLLDT